MEEPILLQGLAELHIPDIPATAQKLAAYIKELELFNASFDLVGADTHDDIVIRHILDSLAPYAEIARLIDAQKERIARSAPDTAAPQQVTVADIGTGGGLPGIPLAICFPDCRFVLVERMTKRCGFLENCKAVLGLQNVTVQNLEAERIPQKSFDLAVFRAFRPLERKMAHILLRTLKPTGFLAAYKARMEKIQAEMDGIAAHVPEWECKELHVPFLPDTERHLVIIPAER